MNTGRYLLTVVVVWVVRVVCNWLFYGVVMSETYQEFADAHPGLFREVIPAYIAIDLLVVIVLVLIVVKCASCFGGGIKGGVIVAVLIALIDAVAVNAYMYYSFTIFELGGMAGDAVYQVVAHAIQGAVAAAIYKPASGTAASPSPGV